MSIAGSVRQFNTLSSDGKPVADGEAFYQFQLLEALRSGEIQRIHPFLRDLSKPGSSPDEGAAMLSKAIKCASYETVEIVLDNKSINPNKPHIGTPALHLAAELGRADVVQLLLEQPIIDDTIKDDQDRTCMDVASTEEVVQVILDSRTALQNQYLALLSQYINAPQHGPGPSGSLLELLKSPRAAILDLNALDRDKGVSLLHEAVRRKDTALVKFLALDRGADVFVKDRKGKSAYDGSAGNDDINNLLKQASNNQKALLQSRPDGKPITQRGYLMKWTNVARGYKSRWFVIEHGILSYYRNQEEENRACRGSVSLKFAQLKPTSSTGFDIQSAGHDARFPKFSLRASHPQEAANWSQAFRQHIDFYKPGGTLDNQSATSTKRPSTTIRRQNTQSSLHALTTGEPSPVPLTSGSLQMPAPSRTSFQRSTTPRAPSIAPSYDDDANTIDDDYEADPSDSVSFRRDPTKLSTHLHCPGIPYQDKFELLASSTRAHIEVTDQLLDSLIVNSSSSSSVYSFPGSPTAPVAIPGNGPAHLNRTPSVNSRQQTVKDSIRQSLRLLQDLVVEYQSMSAVRERWLMARYQAEVDAKRLWEESMQDVARQQAEMERELAEAGRHNRKQQKELRAARLMSPGIPLGPQGDNYLTTPSSSAQGPTSGPPATSTTAGAPVALPSSPDVKIDLPEVSVSDFGTGLVTVQHGIGAQDDTKDDGDEDEDEDEFYDAIEQGTLPLQIPSSIAQVQTQPSAQAQPQLEDRLEEATQTKELLRDKISLDGGEYEPYNRLRSRLPISSDERPPISLWAILKSSIGKDLTKISFPVFFNEPTSMLERMAEDMEYSECLDAAAAEADSLKRLAYVAAFAMSNYSSTEGRIAKPFNPMLGETFEYCRPDKKYRYISEQVSHHPPISACYSDSPHWRYYGEVDAKNKFLGRSFEIRPTGIAHAELCIPAGWAKAPGYPEDKFMSSDAKPMVLEHYSWRKVTTSVSNFIMGSPIIDHFGDMEVTNKRTGEVCVLTFKPRGWKARDSCEIKGVVKDARGQTHWEIAGRWNSQLVARKHGAGHGSLLPDEKLPANASVLSSNMPKEYLLLWKNTVKPAAPFNLSPFAVTLVRPNDIPSGLERWLAPTDCRLRPDQRAFELAKYDEANLGKQQQEAKQRSTRQKRETGELPPHQPRWFSSQTDPDTNERVWAPKRTELGELEYWSERSRAGRDNVPWTNVDDIFIHEVKM
ncbi:Oxysterol-binding protein [Phaffia rhodozyma]|uniref:Oxysterol-binding protein n=1 Tax=Phaffia rhodozyma TaxID=264483 RepID=A0A0F7SPA0_PHARH|nr:Oxysterol-binding protein [Phaffia rhodozyma]